MQMTMLSTGEFREVVAARAEMRPVHVSAYAAAPKAPRTHSALLSDREIETVLLSRRQALAAPAAPTGGGSMTGGGTHSRAPVDGSAPSHFHEVRHLFSAPRANAATVDWEAGLRAKQRAPGERERAPPACVGGVPPFSCHCCHCRRE